MNKITSYTKIFTDINKQTCTYKLMRCYNVRYSKLTHHTFVQKARQQLQQQQANIRTTHTTTSYHLNSLPTRTNHLPAYVRNGGGVLLPCSLGMILLCCGDTSTEALNARLSRIFGDNASPLLLLVSFFEDDTFISS